jgi:hypothetical protein
VGSNDDAAARMTLKTAGVFQEITGLWVRRLEAYFSQLQSLTEGQMLTGDDLVGIIQEARLASKEALAGLGNDLSAELVHESSGLISRHEAERASLSEEITDLRESITRALSGDENAAKRQNEALFAAVMSVPEYRLLEIIRAYGIATYEQLVSASGQKRATVTKQVKGLAAKGYLAVERVSRRQTIRFLSAPWMNIGSELQNPLGMPADPPRCATLAAERAA